MAYFLNDEHLRMIKQLEALGAIVEESDHANYGLLVNKKFLFNTISCHYRKVGEEKSNGQGFQDFCKIVEMDLDPNHAGEDAMQKFSDERNSHDYYNRRYRNPLKPI